MAVKKLKLPDNSSQDIHDARITGVDSAPTASSTNVVTSGGVATAIENLASAISPLSNLLNTVVYNVQLIIDNLSSSAYIGAVPTYEDMGTTWSVTTNLTNYTMEESISEVVKNASYQNTLIPDAGYELGTATITMGGTDITSQCYNSATGEISINSVTGRP